MTMILRDIFEWIAAWWSDGNGHERLASVAIIGGVLLAIGTKLVRSWQRQRYKVNLFKLWFHDKWPSPANPPIMSDSKTVVFGETEVLIGVFPSHSIDIQHFDVRFVKSEKGGNVDPGVIKVIGVSDKLRDKWFMLAEEMGYEGNYPMYGIPSAAGGMDCYYNPAIPQDAERSLYLTVTFQAAQPWDGWLGFRGRDKEGQKVLPSSARFILLSPPIPDMSDSGTEEP